jgi:hypothetical protein
MGSVYSLKQNDAFQALVQINEDGEIAYDESVAIRATKLCGQSFGRDYKPVSLSWGEPRKKKLSDIYSLLSPFIVFSETALETLSPLLKDAGEELSVIAPINNVRGFHVVRALENVVDMAASKFKIYPTATVFSKIVLLGDKVKDVDIFRIKEKPASVFVSEGFKNTVLSNKLKGFDFSEVVVLSP